MGLKLYDTLTPAGEFPLVNAADVAMPDGKRLSEVNFSGETDVEVDILPKQTLEFAYNSDVGCHAVQLNPSPVTLEYGTDYYVEWDGEAFLSTTCNEGEMIFDGAPVIGMGNPGLFGGASDGRPYAIGYIPAADLLAIITADDSATHTIRIYQKVAASALETPTAVDLTQYESNGMIVETYADGTTKTTTFEFDESGNPTKITDGDGNVTTLTWGESAAIPNAEEASF